MIKLFENFGKALTWMRKYHSEVTVLLAFATLIVSVAAILLG